LSKCLRIYTNHNDSGGFFIAIIKKGKDVKDLKKYNKEEINLNDKTKSDQNCGIPNKTKSETFPL